MDVAAPLRIIPADSTAKTTRRPTVLPFDLALGGDAGCTT
jgi:hypothetical protein